MKPLKLKLRNFIGITSGLNREEVDIDLSRHAGLVALTGPNGTGKTTILDSLHPYRLMPFRSGGYSPGQFSYYEETKGDALKDLVWEHEGITYRSEIQIKGANKTQTTKAYLFVQTPEGWAPVISGDGTKSDGKTATYDRCVDGILGSPEMFFTSIFACQGRKSLADYKPGDIKLLLSELLGLDYLLDLSASAEAAGKHLASRLEGLQDQTRRYETAKHELASAEASLAASRTELDVANPRRVVARAALSEAAQVLSEARARAANRDEILRRRHAMQGQIATLELEGRQALAAHQRAVDAAHERGAGADIKADILRLEAQVNALNARIASANAKLAALPDPVATAAELTAAEANLATCEADIKALRETRDAHQRDASRLAQLAAKMEGIKASGIDTHKLLEGHNERAALVKQVPCADLPINSACKLLEAARGAAALAIETEARATKLRADYKALGIEAHPLKAAPDLLAEAIKALQSAEAEQAGLRAAVDTKRRAHQESGNAAAITNLVAQAQNDQATAREGLQQKTEALATRQATVAAEVSGIESRHRDACTARDSRVLELRGELALLPEDAGVEELGRATAAMETADTALAEIDRQLTRLQTGIATLEANAKAARVAVKDGEAAAASATSLAEDAAQWRLLGRALGRDGVVALSIDDAGPAISTIANELLLACYGNRFSIRFDTQAETGKGVMKESFDIRVFDAERGDDKSVTKMSGGEKIWVQEALTRAIGLFQAQQSGRRFQTLFSDESDGALDPERKQHYMRMKRRVLEMGGYDNEFFISHTEELQAQADMTLDVGALRIH